jgi:hypothetical protein
MVYTSISLASVAISLLALSDASAISSTSTSSSITSTTDSSIQPTTTSPTCPKADQNVFIAKSGATYIIECGIDYAGGDLKSVNIASNRIADCINACDATEGCIDISMSGTACYMKQKLNKPLVNKGIRGARKIKDAPISSSSSASSSTSFSTSFSTSHSTSHSTSYSVTVAPTFSEPTASTAPSTASLPTVNQGKEYINYTNIVGYFLQDLASTVPSTFDYVSLLDILSVFSSLANNISDGKQLRSHQPNLFHRLKLHYPTNPMATLQHTCKATQQQRRCKRCLQTPLHRPPRRRLPQRSSNLLRQCSVGLLLESTNRQQYKQLARRRPDSQRYRSSRQSQRILVP